MNAQELKIVAEIARHQVHPNPVQKALSVLGIPLEKALGAVERLPVLQRLPALVHQGVGRALRVSVSAGGRTFSDAGIWAEYRKLAREDTIASFAQARAAPLELRDRVADQFRVSNGLMIGVEGFLMGAGTSLCEGLPGAQLLLPAMIAADIAASLTLLSRHASQVAACYGYSPSDPANLPHVIASMVPYADHREEDGFFSVKGGVIAEVRAASQVLARADAKAPLILRLVQRVATRLELTITQKELGMIIPLAGAGLNGAVNVAFQQAGHICAKDYFRRLALAEKYGDECVQTALLAAVQAALEANR